MDTKTFDQDSKPEEQVVITPLAKKGSCIPPLKGKESCDITLKKQGK